MASSSTPLQLLSTPRWDLAGCAFLKTNIEFAHVFSGYLSVGREAELKPTQAVTRINNCTASIARRDKVAAASSLILHGLDAARLQCSSQNATCTHVLEARLLEAGQPDSCSVAFFGSGAMLSSWLNMEGFG